MADTDWNAFPDTAYIEDADSLLLARNGLGYNVAASAFNWRATGPYVGDFLNLSPASAQYAVVRVRLAAVGAPVAYCGVGSDVGNTGFANAAGFGTQTNHPVNIMVNDAPRWTFLVNGSLQPFVDGGHAMGSAAFRISTVFAVNGQIQTSDEREKTWRGELTEAHIRAARRIIAEIGLFQWNEAVAEKGESEARLHFGPRAQAVARIMVGEGLEAPFEDGSVPHFRHAFLCYDRWDEVPARPAVEEARDDAGEIITPAQPAVPAVPAGDRFGLRVDQLTMFLLAALLGGDVAA